MQLLHKEIDVSSRSEIFNLYPIGDAHVGAFNFASKKFKKYVQRIREDDNALWIGGGDILDAVILQDQKRFDPDNLPAWMLSGSPDKVRRKIKDILKAQMDYAEELLEPIKHKCIGYIEGNHEFSISHYHNRDVTAEMASRLGTVELTDCAFIRFRFKRNSGTSTVRLFICHGHGGGRSAGAEPTHLTRLAQERDCEIIFRGHSHIFHIMPPIPRLTIPTCGELPEHAITHDVRAANWGAWVLSYANGPSTYDSRANYPVRPMCTVVASIKPFCDTYNRGPGGNTTMARISLQELSI